MHERLCREYHCPIPYFHELDPLGELVSSLLSHRTKNKDSGRAYRTLRERLPTWETVRDAPVEDVRQAIEAATWPEQKAPRIQAVLKRITDLRGELSLEFLRDWSIDAARAWLEALPGVGPKTSAAVIAFSSIRGRALPVDSHHHRVAVRLAIIPENLAVGPSHRVLEGLLPPEWDAQRVYDHHEVLMLHGQRCCFHADPACARCPVLHVCPHGQARMKRGSAGARPGEHPHGWAPEPRLDDAPQREPRDAAAE